MESLDAGTQAAFLDRLAKATLAGVVSWTASTGREFWYYTTVGQLSYVIESADSDGAPPYDFHIVTGQEGEAKEVELWRWDRGGNPINQYFENLYMVAHANSLGIANLVEDMFGSLAELDGGPASPTRIDLPEPAPDVWTDDSPF